MKETFIIFTYEKGDSRKNPVKISGPFFKEEVESYLPILASQNPEMNTFSLPEKTFQGYYHTQYEQSLFERAHFFTATHIDSLSLTKPLSPTNESYLLNDDVYVGYENKTLFIGFAVHINSTVSAQIMLSLIRYLPFDLSIQIVKPFYLDKNKEFHQDEFIAQRELQEFPVYSN